MKRRKRPIGVLLIIAALIIMQLPVSEAEAATSSASDFRIEGSTLVKYRGTEKSVSVPDTVQTIGKGAFEDNTNVELVVLPNSVKEIEAYAFWGCDRLDTVVLGRGLKAVGDYAFAGCKGLVQMTLPANVTSVGVQSFADCVNLKDITIPPETVFIHDTAFDGCWQLTIHCQTGSIADRYAQDFYERQKEMPEYEDVPGYSSVSDNDEQEPQPTQTPEPVPAPETEPVPGYSGEENNTEGDPLGNTKVVGNRAVIFLNPEALNVYGAESGAASEVPVSDAPTPVMEFSEGRQEGGLPKYAVVDGRVVADQAYYRSLELSDVSLPESIREIGQFAYARSSLKEIRIPQGVENICYGAFYHCDDLQTVSLPDTVRNVEPKAFRNTAWVERFLSGDSADGGDYLVSGGVLAAYRGNGANVSVPEGVRVIAAEVFQGHEEIQSVTFPESLRVIGEGAFEDCTELKEIALNQGLEQIKDRAFLNCAAEKISVPASVQTIGLRAIEGIQAEYAGEEPERTYEISATRLSNESFRAPEPDAEAVADGVVVESPDGASAVLEGAGRSYVLQITESGDTASMNTAFRRIFGTQMPEGTYVYDMKLTDNSGIPLTKLGRQMLTVVLPLPEALAGQEIRLFRTDRNGQLEEISAEPVTVEGRNSLRFATNTVSQIALCPAGASQAQPVEIGEEIVSMGAPPEAARKTALPWKYPVGCGVLLTGAVLVFAGGRRRSR